MRLGVLRGFALDPGHADGESVEEAFLQVRRRGAQLRGVNRSERPHPGKTVIDDPVPAPVQPALRPGHVARDAGHHVIEKPERGVEVLARQAGVWEIKAPDLDEQSQRPKHLTGPVQPN